MKKYQIYLRDNLKGYLLDTFFQRDYIMRV